MIIFVNFIKFPSLKTALFKRIVAVGNLQVTDMGLAKFVIGKTYTTCGTPDYFAPEVIASTGHTHAVDWWMCGVLIFEFMTGSAPFEAPYPMQIYAKARQGCNLYHRSVKRQKAGVTGYCKYTTCLYIGRFKII